MYDSLGSHFFRTTNGIQPGPDAFDESRLVMTFVTNLGVTNILCSFRWSLKEKQVKRKLPYQDLSSWKSFHQTISDAEDNTCGPLNRGGIADLTLLGTLLAIHQNSRAQSLWEVIEYVALFS